MHLKSVDSEHKERYKCYHKACEWIMEKENVDWGYYSNTSGDCSDCLTMCDKNDSCEAVECGDNYCSWWQNDKCNDDDKFSMDTIGSFHTCVKMVDDANYSR